MRYASLPGRLNTIGVNIRNKFILYSKQVRAAARDQGEANVPHSRSHGNSPQERA
jgi:hypothetical protein